MSHPRIGPSADHAFRRWTILSSRSVTPRVLPTRWIRVGLDAVIRRWYGLRSHPPAEVRAEDVVRAQRDLGSVTPSEREAAQAAASEVMERLKNRV